MNKGYEVKWDDAKETFIIKLKIQKGIGQKKAEAIVAELMKELHQMVEDDS